MRCDVCRETIEPLLNAAGEVVWTQGHNPFPLCKDKLGKPLPDDARCCNACNADVMVARLRHLKGVDIERLRVLARKGAVG